MCVFNVSEISILDKDLIAYKAVLISDKKGKYYSRFDIEHRKPQVIKNADSTTSHYPKKLGTVETYSLNEQSFSSFEETPGFYCYSLLNGAEKAGMMHPKSAVLLEVLIPKGTKIKIGATLFGNRAEQVSDIVLTEYLIPLREIQIPTF